MILCINFIVLSFTGEIPQGVFLGGCGTSLKVGGFIICTFGFRVFSPQDLLFQASFFRLLFRHFSGFFFRQGKVSIKVSIACS